MGLFDWISDWLASPAFSESNDVDSVAGCGDPLPTSDSTFDSIDDFAVNPANGLPMIDGTGGVDIEGNPYGFDLSHDDAQGLFPSSGSDGFGFCDSNFSTDDNWSGCSDDDFSDW